MTEQHKGKSGQVCDSIEPLLDHVLATLAQTDMIGELGARRHDLAVAIRHRHWEAVRVYVREAPLDLIPDETDCLYVRGLALWRLERLREAEICFEQARQYYLVVGKDPAHAALCCLELADLCNDRGQYRTASHYLETARALLAEASQANPLVAARSDLIAAVVAPNVGRPRDAIDHGKRALHTFQIRGDKADEFLALMAIASAAFQLGDYAEASSRLDQAKLCYASGLVNRRYFARILNTEAHIEWYRGNLAAGD